MLSSDAIRVVAFALGMGVLIAAVFADTVASGPTVGRCCAVALLAGGAAVLLSVAEGKVVHPAYSLWQPFKGGREFVLLQMVGWSFFAFSSLLFFIIAQSVVPPMQNGLISALGCASLAAVLTLFTSIDRFDSRGVAYDIRLFTPSNLVILALGTASIAEAAILELHLPRFVQWETDMIRATFATNIASIVAVCGMGYWRIDWSMFQPFQGGFDFILLQGGGWAGLGVASYMSAILSLGKRPEGAVLVTCVLHGISLLLMVASFDVFRPGGVSTTEMLSWVMHTPRGVVGCASISAVAFVAVCCVDFMGMTHSLVGYATSLTLLTGPPATHILASRHVAGYGMWQPFAGGGHFVLLQGVAWTVYSVGGVGTLLSLINDFPTLPSATGLFVCLSAVLVCVSTDFVEEMKAASPRAGKGDVLNSEFITAALLSAFGLIISAMGDFSKTYFSRQEMATLAVMLCFTGVLGSQFSGTKAFAGSFRFFQPFQGGIDFIVLQSVGWTAVSVAVPVSAVVLLNTILSPEILPLGSSVALCALICSGQVVLMFSLLVFDPSDVGDTNTSSFHDAVLTPCLNFAIADDSLSAARREAEALAHTVCSPHLRDLMLSLSVGHLERKSEYSSGVAVAGGIISVALFINAELFYALVPPETATFPCQLFCLSAVVLTVCSAMCIHFVTGPRRFRKAYRPWMPLEGGTNFVILQSAGWLLMVFNVLLGSMLLASLRGGASILRGAFLLAGAEAASVSIVLLVSLRYFDVNCLTDSAVQTGFVFRNEGWCVGCIMTMCSVLTFAITQGLTAQLGPLPSTDILIELSLVNCYLSIPIGWLSVGKVRELRQADEPFSLSVEVICCGWLVQLLLWAMSRSDRFLPIAVAACIAGASHIYTLLLLLHREEKHIWRRVQAEVATMVLYGWPAVVLLAYATAISSCQSNTVRSLLFLATCFHSSGGRWTRLASGTLAGLSLTVSLLDRDFFSAVVGSLSVLYVGSTVTNEAAISWGMRLSAWAADMVCHVRPVIVDTLQRHSASSPTIFVVEPGVTTMTLLRAVRMGVWCDPSSPILLHSWMFQWPLVRDVLLLANVKPFTEETFNAALESGGSVVVCPGSVLEFEQQGLSDLCVRYEGQGWLRKCCQLSVLLVPVVIYGEVLPPIPTRWVALQQWCFAATGLALPIPCGARLSTFTPPSRPLHVVVGGPIATSCPAWMGPELCHEEVFTRYRTALEALIRSPMILHGPLNLRVL